jgi:hypothetical protein
MVKVKVFSRVAKTGAIALRRSFAFVEQGDDFRRKMIIEPCATVKQEYGNQNITA